jgi:cysteine sulfinate desulfinase/cysteine desulfurase-like protein
MGLDEATAAAAVRVSLGWGSAPDHVEALVAVLPAVIDRAQAAGRVRAVAP